MNRLWSVALVTAAAAAALLPIPPALVERWYSSGLYPRLQHVLTPISNVIPFALFDVLTMGAVVLVIVLLLVTGVLGPQSNAHGPNEFLHLPSARRLTAALAQVLHDAARTAHDTARTDSLSAVA